VNPAQAASIVEWDLLGAPGNQASTAASSAATNVTGTNLTRGPGLTPTGAGNSFSASGWNVGEYFEFGFSVDAGFSVDLDTLFIGTRSSNTGPGSLGLFYSGDSFTNSLFTFSQSGSNFLNSTVDLSALTGLTGNVNFRVVNLSNTSANGGTVGGGGTFRVGAYFDQGSFANNLSFTGTVNNPVPVPAAVWLLGSAVAGMAGVARRKAA
jgi:hypothetical protein